MRWCTAVIRLYFALLTVVRFRGWGWWGREGGGRKSAGSFPEQRLHYVTRVNIVYNKKDYLHLPLPAEARTRTNNKLNPHMTPSSGIKPEPLWWEASALTTAPSLLLQYNFETKPTLEYSATGLYSNVISLYY